MVPFKKVISAPVTTRNRVKRVPRPAFASAQSIRRYAQMAQMCHRGYDRVARVRAATGGARLQGRGRIKNESNSESRSCSHF